MAANTDPSLQKQVIYSVFTRNHTPEGSFRALIPDLPRIRALGIDIIWLMPIHPIGEKARKGSLGSPYANRDYRSVNPELGTEDDLRALADAVHAQGMKLMIDVVYNHTSPDSVLWETHPEWFYKKPDGRPGNRVGDWTDIIDLDYSHPGLWDYQIESLKKWAGIVDGFRCDVASLVPLEFWKRARAEVEKVRPGCVWLAESVHRSFNAVCRLNGMYAMTDAEGYEAFDIEYEYDIRETFDAWLDGRLPLSAWIDMLNFQDQVYPENYNKLRFLENHDQPRIASKISAPEALRSLTAMLYFLKGTTLIYAGQELSSEHLPSLFDRDPVDWSALGSSLDISPLMARMACIKKEYLSPDDIFFGRADDANRAAVLVRDGGGLRKTGIFPITGQPCELRAGLPDGEYTDIISGDDLKIFNNTCISDGTPKIIVSKSQNTGQANR